MRKRSRSPLEQSSVEEPLINLTPLIDVVFVVLIAFILIAPLLNIDSIDLAVGAKTKQKDYKQSSMQIFVHKDNSIWYKNSRISLSDLKKISLQLRKNNPNITPQLICDQKAEFGTYQALKNMLESSGFEELDIVLKPK